MMRELTIQEAEKLAEQRLDRRRRYATTDDGQPDECYGGALLFTRFAYTTPCSGCHETIDGHPVQGAPVDGNGVALGCGCHECGYTGKRHNVEWGPHDVQPKAGEEKGS